MNRIFISSSAFLLFTLLLSTRALAQAKNKTAVKQVIAEKSPVTKPPQSTGPGEPWKQLSGKEKLVEITTDYGVMVAKLYDSTPKHKDNFIRLINEGFYDSLLFHRVIDDFMIQGGDPASKNAAEGVVLGNGSLPGERIPSELKSYLFHKKGALAAARDDNPQKASSNCQFYIVDGKAMSDTELNDYYTKRVQVVNPNFKWTNTQREIYSRIGGAPFLDQAYTVFGEIISGLDVIDKIAKAPKNASDRPLQNIRMKIRLLN